MFQEMVDSMDPPDYVGSLNPDTKVDHKIWLTFQ